MLLFRRQAAAKLFHNFSLLKGIQNEMHHEFDKLDAHYNLIYSVFSTLRYANAPALEYCFISTATAKGKLPNQI